MESGRVTAQGHLAPAPSQQAHRRQFVLELAQCLVGRQGLEQVGQLRSAAHNLRGDLLSDVLSDLQAIFNIIEQPNCLVRAHHTIGQRFD